MANVKKYLQLILSQTLINPKSEQVKKVHPIPKAFHGSPILLFVFLIFFIIHFLLDIFVDLSRHANILCLHMLIIVVQALMDDQNSRRNWNIQDWMYYARPIDESNQCTVQWLLIVFILLITSEVSKYFKSGKSVSPGINISALNAYISSYKSTWHSTIGKMGFFTNKASEE